jgi:8-oxo-dGTP pyrophosphatase MutT (NUDIX family)
MTKHLTVVFPISTVDDTTYILMGKQPAGRPMAGFVNGYGGKVEEGESIESAAVRELVEETGINTVSLQKIGIITHQNRDIHFFVTVVDKVDIMDTNEMIENTWYLLDDDSFISQMVPGDSVMIDFIRENREKLIHGEPIAEFHITKAGVDVDKAAEKLNASLQG